MPGDVDLGYNLHMKRLAKLNDLAYLVFREITAVNSLLLASESYAVAVGTDLIEKRILFDFDSESVVVRKMPVEKVELKHSRSLNEALHLIDGLKMTR